MKISDQVETFAGRISGTFDLTPEEGERLEQDEEVTLVVTGRVKQSVLDTTKGGGLRLSFVLSPSDAYLVNRDALDWAGPPADVWPRKRAEVDQIISENEQDTLRQPVFDPDEVPDEMWDEPQPSDGPEYHADHAYWEDVKRKRGVPSRPVSTLSPHSNVAGTSQAERDSTLRDFVYGSGK